MHPGRHCAAGQLAAGGGASHERAVAIHLGGGGGAGVGVGWAYAQHGPGYLNGNVIVEHMVCIGSSTLALHGTPHGAPQVRLPLSSLPCTYKYGIRRGDGSLELEAGENRMVALPVGVLGSTVPACLLAQSQLVVLRWAYLGVNIMQLRQQWRSPWLAQH